LRDVGLLSIVLRVALAILIGGILGLERGRKHRPAGFRTYMLVCLGSAMVMMTNQYVYEVFSTSDPVRMGAQVISGIGFLGAGTILITGKNQVRGITTAAGLWAAACCGLAIGIGFYEMAIIGGAAVFAIMTIMQYMDGHIHRNSRTVEVYIEFGPKQPLRQFIEYSRKQGINLSDVQLQKNKLTKDMTLSVILTAHCPKGMNHDELIDVLGGAPGVEYIEEL
jgi:putative Mg2+ transporter-C (MgtC) family protein